ncbi:electron transfer flavoprotein subunit beta/FixA family protein [Entomohabitans teleogrylli]|uniref:electron transfer flavoprotein subunit beta/FixA family protein n=1 Tax=Entomohabitans teleogrylli TaxID=1384589 RepID=UPI00073D8FFF|nr:hypothetical protein [Entomohabitans teleogrylli]
MNILLAFKAEPDLSMLAQQDWLAACENLRPDPSLMRMTMGADEQGAAELMLQARDRHPGLHLSALTLGDERSTTMLRQLSALGFDYLTRINCIADLRFTPAFVAGLIAGHITRRGIELVMVGTQSSEGQNGQTGWLLAEMLGWPCLTQVTALSCEGDTFQVQCESDAHRQRWRLQQPAVLMVQNRGQMALRVPGIRARLAAAQADIELIENSALITSPLQCQALARHVARRPGLMIEAGDTREKAHRLWREYLAQRMMR